MFFAHITLWINRTSIEVFAITYLMLASSFLSVYVNYICNKITYLMLASSFLFAYVNYIRNKCHQNCK